jgi:D-alanyl-D-alanine carboxypeptidase
MAARRGLEVLTEVAEDVIAAFGAIGKLKAGTNGGAVRTLVKALEREVRRVVSVRLRSKRRTAQRSRDAGGRLL